MNNNKQQLSQEMNAEQHYELPPLSDFSVTEKRLPPVSDYVVTEYVVCHYEAKEVVE